MGKRKAKKRSNSTLKTTSYFKRFQVKFARRRAGEYHKNPGIASVARVFSDPARVHRRRALGRERRPRARTTRTSTVLSLAADDDVFACVAVSTRFASPRVSSGHER